MSVWNISEEDAIRALVAHIQIKYSSDDIRDIYRIIHLLLELLTEDEQYKYHYNKHYMIMRCLYQFYIAYPNSRVAVHSYHAYVSECIHEANRAVYNKKREIDRERYSFSKYCVIS